jgi:hypothetical protein
VYPLKRILDEENIRRDRLDDPTTNASGLGVPACVVTEFAASLHLISTTLDRWRYFFDKRSEPRPRWRDVRFLCEDG